VDCVDRHWKHQPTLMRDTAPEIVIFCNVPYPGYSRNQDTPSHELGECSRLQTQPQISRHYRLRESVLRPNWVVPV
jgi:hypothetical protein